MARPPQLVGGPKQYASEMAAPFGVAITGFSSKNKNFNAPIIKMAKASQKVQSFFSKNGFRKLSFFTY